jgi:hypothetical protein
MNSPGNNSLMPSGTKLVFSVVEPNLEQLRYSIDEGSEIIMSLPYNISTKAWADKEYLIKLYAIDYAGNSNSSWFSFTIDSTKPAVLLTSPANNSVIPNGTLLDFSVIEDNLLEANYSLKGDIYPFMAPFDISTSGWEDDVYTIQINAVDIVGNSNSALFSFTIDSSLPIISSVSVSFITESSATISWTTDKLADSRLIWSEYPDLSENNSDYSSILTTSHFITLTDLSPNQIYYFEARSQGQFGSIVIDDNGSHYYRFKTLPHTSPQDDKAGKQTYDYYLWLILLMVIVAVVLITILILFTQKKSKMKEGVAEKEAPVRFEPTGQDQQPPSPSFPPQPPPPKNIWKPPPPPPLS